MQTYPDEPRTPQAQTLPHPAQGNPTGVPPAFGNSQAPGTPVRFAATTGAFNLTVSTAATPPPRDLQPGAVSPTAATTPPSNGTVATHKLRRPSLLSLVPSTSEDQASSSGSQRPGGQAAPGGGGLAAPVPTFASTGRWGLTAFSAPARVGSAPPIPIEGLTTSTSPIPSRSEHGTSPMVEEKWQLRRSSGDGHGHGLGRALHGRPIPGSLLATLISESSPLEHEMRSEARLQRLISSHPSAIPLTLTPRQRRMSRMARGRFPESVDDDDDDGPAPLGARWRADSDTDSDSMMDEEWPAPANGSAVNSAFASVMDIDRPASNGSWPRSDSGKSTPSTNATSSGPKGTPQAQRLDPAWKGRIGQSPGASTLITSFGNVGFAAAGNGNGNGNGGMVASGRDTPLGSPTVEKSELAGSSLGTASMGPGSVGASSMGAGSVGAGSAGSPSVASPGMMQYRDPVARAGKRKGEPSPPLTILPFYLITNKSANNVEDRFDPYKRPRASSPSPFQALSPSKPTGVAPVPIPSSPSHAPLVASSLATSSPGYLSLGQSRVKPPHHPYTRPMASRSRAASPALSIGSTSGVLSSSLNGNRTLGGAFIPTGPAATAAASAAQSQGAAPGLGSLGLLSLQGEGAGEQEMLRDEVCEEGRRSSGHAPSDAMEED